MVTNCPKCGKAFDVLYPHLWRYKRGGSFLCSYGCMRAHDREKGAKPMQKITLENKKRAVEIAISGGNPLEYLRSCGSDAPDKLWHYIKSVLKEKEPETYAKIPDLRKTANAARVKPAKVTVSGPLTIETPEANEVEIVETPEKPTTMAEAMQGMKDAADTFFGLCEDMDLKLDTPKPIAGGEREKMETPYGPLPTYERRYTAVETSAGDFQYFRKQGYLDWTPLDGSGAVSLTIEEWKEFLRVFPLMAADLGVEL